MVVHDTTSQKEIRMSDTIPVHTLREDHEDETRIVELSSSYEGTSGCYHWLSRKLAIFEQGEVVIQWHNGVNAPVDVRLTFAELDALIEQFNTYCEDFDHVLPDEVFAPVSSVEALPDWGQVPHEPCTCSVCTSQDAGFSYYPSRPAASLVLLQTVVPVADVVPEPCGGPCWLCDNSCVKPENHSESCYCSEHK
jgi:hypothetical protein